MSKIKFVAAAVAASLMLSACEIAEENTSPVNSDWSASGRVVLAGGALYACSSMAQSDCNDWDAYRTTSLADIDDSAIRLPVNFGVALTTSAIEDVLSDPAWDSAPEFLDATEVILTALQAALEAPAYTYATWDDFRADFRAFVAEDVNVNDSEGNPISGLALWNNTSDEQFSTLERLELMDDTFQYTITGAKVDALLAQQDIVALDDTLFGALSETLDRSIYDGAQSQQEVIGYFAKINVVDATINGYKLWTTYLSDSEYDLLLSSLDDGENYVLNQTNIDSINADTNEIWDELNQADVVAVLQYLFDENGSETLEYDSSSALRADFRSVYLDGSNQPVTFEYEFGDQVWAELTTLQKNIVLQGLVDALPEDYQRPFEYVALQETADSASVNVFESVVDLVLDSSPKILVMTSSSNNSYDAVDFYVNVFEQAGGDVTWLPIDRAFRDAQLNNRCDLLAAYHSTYASDAHLDLLYPDHYSAHLAACEDPSTLLDLINSADVIFINGGGQRRTLDALMPIVNGERVDSAEMALIRERFHANELIVGGTSAGAAVQGGGSFDSNDAVIPMIDGGTAHSVLRTGYDEGIAVFEGGLGLFDFGIADTHFSERARETRLIKLAEQAGVRFGYGVDETTALVVQRFEHKTNIGQKQAEMSVVGKGGVYIVDLANATVNSGTGENLDIEGVVSHYIGAGDRLEVSNVNGNISVVNASEFDAQTSLDSGTVINDDVLYQDNYRAMMVELIENGAAKAEGTSYENDPEYQVFVTRNANSLARIQANGNVSYSNMIVDVFPSPVQP